ncbi:MAG TPA: DUF11 domain-containing protein [Pyrinomonadaceae bacterium]|nr:DUF11 domain-containing protein [Pyrinomonadaceae bacterium]
MQTRNYLTSSKVFYFLAIISIFCLFQQNVFAQTAADTQIKNTATVTFSDGTTTYSNSSNEVVVTVAKVAGLTITPDAQVDSAVIPGQTGVVKTFRVTNIGNFTDDVIFGANGTSLRVTGPATITSATVGGSATNILTNSSAVTQSLTQNGFVDVTITLSINAGATLGSTIQLFLGDASSGTNFDNVAADNSANEVHTVSTGANNGSREARGDISFPVNATDLTISKTHTAANFTRGSTGTYDLTVSNVGNIASSGTITITDTLPIGLTVNGGTAGTVTPSGTNAANWTCNSNAASPQVITCTSSTSITASGSSTFTLTVNIGNNAASSVTNNVSVAGGGEVNTTNDTASDPTAIISVANLGITKTDGNIVFYPAESTTYTIVVSNSGPSSANNAVFTDPAVPNLTVTGVTCGSAAGGAACPTSGNTTVALMQGSGIIIPTLPSGGSVTFTVTGTYGSATTSIVNTATIAAPSGVTDPNTTNNSATDTNDLAQPVTLDVSLTKSGPATAQPSSNITYTLVVNNNSGIYNEGSIVPDYPMDIPNVTVEDILPAGVTFVSADNGGTYNSGTNKISWNLGTMAAGATQTLTVIVTTPNAAAVSAGNNSLFNSATVSAPGDSISTNNTGTATTVLQVPVDLTIAKTHSGSFNANSTGTYNLTVNNIGTAASSGTITVTDNLPTGLSVNNGAAGAVTLSGTNAANWSCSSNASAPQTITCTSSTAIAASGSGTFSFVVNVASNVASTITNNASVSGGNEPPSNTGNNTASDPTNTNALPNVQLVKSCPSPANCTTAAQLPGTDLTYNIAFTNTGGQTAANLTIVDGVPNFTDYKLGSATTSLGTTGLIFTIEYSSDYDPLNPTLANWTYTPVSAGGGASAGYDRNVKAIRWRVSSGTLSNVSPNNTGTVSFITKIR